MGFWGKLSVREWVILWNIEVFTHLKMSKLFCISSILHDGSKRNRGTMGNHDHGQSYKRFCSQCTSFLPHFCPNVAVLFLPPRTEFLRNIYLWKSLKFKIHLNIERTLCQNYRAYNSCTNINGSHLLRGFQICLTLYCSFYGSRIINVYVKSLKIKIHLKVERGKSSNF